MRHIGNITSLHITGGRYFPAAAFLVADGVRIAVCFNPIAKALENHYTDLQLDALGQRRKVLGAQLLAYLFLLGCILCVIALSVLKEIFS